MNQFMVWSIVIICGTLFAAVAVLVVRTAKSKRNTVVQAQSTSTIAPIQNNPGRSFCLHCGAEVPQDARFCRSCGQAVGVNSCPACGFQIPENSHYCPSCGKGLVLQSTPETLLSPPQLQVEKPKPVRPTSPLMSVIILVITLGVVGTVLYTVTPDLKDEILGIFSEMGFGDKLALNSATDSYLNQTWRGQTLSIPADGASTLSWKSSTGVNMIEIYPGGQRISITNNKNARNPTMAELAAFLKADQTEKNVYQAGKFVCSNYAVIIHDKAEAQGIRCAFVSINGTGDGHAINAFQTTDCGLVLVDDTGSTSGIGVDRFAKVILGSEVSEVAVFRSNASTKITSLPAALGQITNAEMWW